jgi:hypothetical protein
MGLHRSFNESIQSDLGMAALYEKLWLETTINSIEKHFIPKHRCSRPAEFGAGSDLNRFDRSSFSTLRSIIDGYRNAIPRGNLKDLRPLRGAMNELNPKNTAKSAEADKELESLSHDDKAAFEKIMAEIAAATEASRKPSIYFLKTDTPDEFDASLTGSQEPDESVQHAPEEQKEHHNSDLEPESSGKEPVVETPDKSRDRTNLTLEQFNDELNCLLHSANIPPAVSGQAPAAMQPPPGGLTHRDDSPEISMDHAPPPQAGRNSGGRSGSYYRRPTPKGARLRKAIFGLTLILAFLLVLCGGYFGYLHFFSSGAQTWPHNPAVITAPFPQAAKATMHADPPVDTAGFNLPIHLPNEKTGPTAAVLAGLKNDLSDARTHVQKRIYEIQQLRSYLLSGIEEEAYQIREILGGRPVPSVQAALKDSRIELPLRAIQRRKTYAAKLEEPLGRLQSMFEDLLYLERRTLVYEILNRGIDDLPADSFSKEVSGAIDLHLQHLSQLSIEDVEFQEPSLAVIWKELVPLLEPRPGLPTQLAGLNRTIGAEICNGSFDRAHQLTALSAEAAACLAKWPGKDLYLNSVTEITPEAADALSRWPGEWLSFNGVKELSAETAAHLSRWPGRHLSFNGLQALPQEVAEQLSRWRGEQLEMIGLRAIGSWPNGDTRLFLSEDLRRRMGER